MALALVWAEQDGWPWLVRPAANVLSRTIEREVDVQGEHPDGGHADDHADGDDGHVQLVEGGEPPAQRRPGQAVDQGEGLGLHGGGGTKATGECAA